VTKTFNHVAFGVAAENPQLLYSAALAGDTPYAILGSAGANGGNYNAAISGLSGLSTYVQSYTGLTTEDSAGNSVYSYVRNYNTVSANSNIANISFNQAPDLIAKIAIDPGWGHYEILGIAGFAHETVYPGVTQNSVKYGGITDIQGFAGAAPGTAVVAKSSTAGYYVNSIVLGGFGASLRVPIIKDKLTFGAKGLYGPAWAAMATVRSLTSPTMRAATWLQSTTVPACSLWKRTPPRGSLSTSTTAETMRDALTSQPRHSRSAIRRPPSAKPA